MTKIDVPVLIVGGGRAGLPASMLPGNAEALFPAF